MTSTYTANNGIEKIATGDQSGTWGETTNTNFDIIDRALNGVGSITLSGTSHTLTTTDGSLTDGMFKVLSLAGSPTGTNTITISPNDQDKLYFVKNASGQSAVFSQGTGANVTIPNGSADIIFADGAGSGAAVSSLFASAINFGGRVICDDTTDATSTTDGSVQTDGGLSVAKDAIFGNDVTLKSDDAVISFGADADVKITHDPDDGLFFKSTATGDDNPFVLTIQTGETDIAASDKLGVINFQAPDEGTGTDAILVAAGIEAVSEGDFSASSNATSLVFKTGASEAAAEKVRITSAGKVGIGTNNPQYGRLHIFDDNSDIDMDSNGSGQLHIDGNGYTFGLALNANGAQMYTNSASRDIIFGVNETERMRITDGNVGIGTTSPDVPLHVKGGSSVESAIIVDSTGVGGGHKYGIRPGSPSVSNGYFTIHDEVNNATRFTITDGGIVGIGTAGPSGGTALDVRGTGVIQIVNTDTVQLLASNGGSILKNVSNNVFLFGTNNTEVARFDTSGRFMTRKTSTGLEKPGVETHTADNGFLGTTSTGATLHCNREDSDGTLVTFRHDNTAEGSIIISGTTVTYNGGHLGRWSQASDGNRIDGLLKGTVMTNLDKMAVWTKEDGTIKDNEQLNCMAISSVEGDANVAGVFINWNEDKEEELNDPYGKSCVNDMNVAMTGDMVIRIASGTTIARGDLLMSAGDGTAKPQGDDIVRSKTVAKVTSTHVSHTYSDGSYLVPCVLMAC